MMKSRAGRPTFWWSGAVMIKAGSAESGRGFTRSYAIHRARFSASDVKQCARVGTPPQLAIADIATGIPPAAARLRGPGSAGGQPPPQPAGIIPDRTDSA